MSRIILARCLSGCLAFLFEWSRSVLNDGELDRFD
jgi:hypothetical protein